MVVMATAVLEKRNGGSSEVPSFALGATVTFSAWIDEAC